MAKRGMELPVNTLIVVSVAVIVLLVVVGMFSGTISLMPFKDEAKLNAACMKWQRTSCDGTTYTTLQVEGETVKSICETYFEGLSVADAQTKCEAKCCPIGGAIASLCAKCDSSHSGWKAGSKTCEVGAVYVSENDWYCKSDASKTAPTENACKKLC